VCKIPSDGHAQSGQCLLVNSMLKNILELRKQILTYLKL
jgi:hypothetical protein